MLTNALIVPVVVAVCYGIHQFLDSQGMHGKYYKHHPGDCRRVPDVDLGSEDIHVTSDGKAFITSGLLLPDEHAQNKGPTGKILLFDFKDPSLRAVKLEIKADKTGFDVQKFRPHGLSLLEDSKKGEHLLYVVNHPVGLPDLIEKFRYAPESQELIHIRSIPVGNKLQMTNDLALVAEDQFYISNFAVLPRSYMLLERFLPLSLGALFFYNGSEMQEVVSSLGMPNGVTLSPDHRHLYLGSSYDKFIRVYRLDPATKGAQLLQKVQIHGMGDNIVLSQSGDALIVGTQPNMLKHLDHEKSPIDMRSPSSVIRLPLKKDGLIQEDDVTELFYDHGDLISGASVAAIFDGQMLIGSVVDFLVHCDLYEDV